MHSSLTTPARRWFEGFDIYDKPKFIGLSKAMKELYPTMKANDKQVGGKHYKQPIQHWDFVIANKIPYLEAVAIKYLCRHREKNGKEDLQKAIHYIEKLIETEYP